MDFLTELLLVNFFVWNDNFISKFINDYITDRIINIIKITNNMFFNDIFSFFILLIIVFSMKSGFEQQRNISSVFYPFLVVLGAFLRNFKVVTQLNLVSQLNFSQFSKN